MVNHLDSFVLLSPFQSSIKWTCGSRPLPVAQITFSLCVTVEMQPHRLSPVRPYNLTSPYHEHLPNSSSPPSVHSHTCTLSAPVSTFTFKLAEGIYARQTYCRNNLKTGSHTILLRGLSRGPRSSHSYWMSSFSSQSFSSTGGLRALPLGRYCACCWSRAGWKVSTIGAIFAKHLSSQPLLKVHQVSALSTLTCFQNDG